MNPALSHMVAVERNAEAIRVARRNPVLLRPPRPPAEPASRRGLVAAFTRRLSRPHALRTESHRL
jgi:hypothetical protein